MLPASRSIRCRGRYLLPQRSQSGELPPRPFAVHGGPQSLHETRHSWSDALPFGVEPLILGNARRGLLAASSEQKALTMAKPTVASPFDLESQENQRNYELACKLVQE